MFYDKDLMNSKSLGKVWRIGHGLNEESDEVSIANVCDKLDLWVDSTNEESSRRLSLRASSVFIDGAARLYKRKLEMLFEDTQRLEQDMSRPKKFRGLINNESNISQTFTDPEFQVRSSDSDATVPNEMQALEFSHTDSTTTNTECEKTNQNTSSEFEHTTINHKIDKGVQTSPKKRKNIRRFEQNLPSDSSFDQNLPFGFVVVHDNYHSRIPSRIIFSSLSPDVGRLI
ncbi:hypothetical protein ABMA27_008643 [Loxostege sticticalis]|uniref:Rad21/Rec8-like protein N-terminal domain-containing protein n=1 Tax=Loxostege sticticalis TaxID=481309 RepID=A0ABR3HC32_LOXSC